MPGKRALIVDDSKSARVVLSRMLEKYDIDVDTAESAEQAIDYLGHHRPDAIFMDHLMPGMDGLQALQAIKGNPQTATIPIMMYTSQEGELYVGQARALGAMGVLPKQVRPVDVSKVLYELHLLADRRDRSESVLQPVELSASGTPVPAGSLAADSRGSQLAADPEALRRLEGALRDQGAELRRFVVASLDSFATRIVADLRDGLPNAAPLPTVPAPPAKTVAPWKWGAAIAAALLPAVLFAWLWRSASADRDAARKELVALNAATAEIKRSQAALADSVRDITAAFTSQSPAGGASAVSGLQAVGLGATTARAPQRVESVPYGEVPLDRSRTDALRELLSKLEAQGFHGLVRVTSFAGMFCLNGSGGEGYAPASASIPLSKCELIGNPFDEGLSGPQRQSLAFANLATSVRQRTAGVITVLAENAGASRNVADYPQRSDNTTAGEWNKAAAANNRVEFTVEPSS
jgi:CheY-like chemotaxis protein